MTGTATRTGSRLGLQTLLALLLTAALALPAMAHYGKVNHGVDAVGVTSATRISLGRVVVKGTVACSKTTSGVWIGASVQQVAGRTNTIYGESGYSENYGGGGPGGGGDFPTIRCVAGTKVPFSLTITPFYGKFVGGSALVSAIAYKETWSYNRETDQEHYHWDSARIEREMKLTR